VVVAEPDGGTLTDRDRATQPNHLERMFIARANARDLDGLVALYESDAVLMTFPRREIAVGRREIRDALERMLAEQQEFVLGEQRPPVVSGDVALTSTRLPDGAITTEVARRQPDGTWLWVIDRYNILE
jgi:ketosteroid isomerase-like protein